VFNGMHRFLPTLMRGKGYVVIEHGVNHRERLHGISKYGVRNRLWRGIRDCFGIRWYLSRVVPGSRLRLMDE
jgi:dolichol-phosphate mannosyltransferase